jgi:hypothetical protein
MTAAVLLWMKNGKWGGLPRPPSEYYGNKAAIARRCLISSRSDKPMTEK